MPYLAERFHLTADEIVDKTKRVMSRKVTRHTWEKISNDLATAINELRSCTNDVWTF